MWTPRTPPVSARTLVSAASGRLVELRVQKIGEPMDLGSPEGDSGKGRQEFEVRGWMIKLWVGVRFLLREYARHTVHTLCTHTHTSEPLQKWKPDLYMPGPESLEEPQEGPPYYQALKPRADHTLRRPPRVAGSPGSSSWTRLGWIGLSICVGSVL